MKKLKKRKFNNWKEYYFQYQYNLASEYYIPELEKNGIECKNKKILEIGCGNGGFIAAFNNNKNKCYGIDIKDMEWQNNSNIMYKQANIFDKDVCTFLNTKFDIIILRDVIEHIDNNLNNKLISIVNSLSKNKTNVIITFPPFYSAFGLHQQSLVTSALRFFPFLSICPRSILIPILKLIGNPIEKNKEIIELHNSKMTISSFKNLIKKHKIDIISKKFYFSRPSHKIRYGIPILISRLISKIPVLREFLISGVFYTLKIKK
tara:strand:+ start:47 stop:832 length:786 start_codon:yes stop_codon:yes gene_type:complete